MSRWLLLAILTLITLPAHSEDEQSITELWRETLRYGVDSEVLEVIKRIDRADERSLNEELLSLLKESLNTPVRVAVLDFFGKIKYRPVESTLLSLLADRGSGDTELMIGLLRCLSALEGSSATELLIPLLDHDDPAVVRAAITALSKGGDQHIVKLILEKLEDPDFPESLKPDLILALGELRAAEAVEVLLGILNDDGRERIWRLYASSALGKIGDERAVPILKSLFGEQDSLLRIYAISALSFFNIQEVEDLLIQGLRDSNVKVRLASAEALANPEARNAVKILIYKARRDPEAKVRLEAIKSLGVIGTGEAFDFLQELYQDSLLSHQYRQSALESLAKHDLNASLGIIREVVERDLPGKDQKTLEFTGKILAQHRDPALKGLLVDFLDSPNPILRIHGLRGIANNRFIEFRERIEVMAQKDPHPAVRSAALSILDQL